MNGFWKGLIASVVIYQFILTYCILRVSGYLMGLSLNVHGNNPRLLELVFHADQVAMILVVPLIVLVIFNLVARLRSR